MYGQGSIEEDKPWDYYANRFLWFTPVEIFYENINPGSEHYAEF